MSAITFADLVDFFRKRGRGDPPAALVDIFGGPLIKVSGFLGAKMDLARAEQSVDTILALIEDPTTLSDLASLLGSTPNDVTAQLQSDLDSIANNLGLSRRAATASSGEVLLTRNSPLTIPPNQAITVAQGRKLFSPSLNQQYAITDTFFITSMSFNPTLQQYVFSVPVTSVGTGIDTVAGTDQITQLQDPILGIDGCTNTSPVIGGRDPESDSDFANRIKIALSSNNIGSNSGYTLLILGAPNLNNVKGVSVIGAGSPFMLRDEGGGGSVDIFVTDPVPVAVTELATASNMKAVGGKFVFSPSTQPIINDISSVLPADVFSINKDVNIFGGSLKALDTITFNSDHAGSFITYQANDLVRQVDTFVQDPSVKIFGSDVLIREAIVNNVDVQCTVLVLPQFFSSRSTVHDNVVNAITQLIAALGIGVTLEQSNVIKAITEVPGVDRVNLPLTQFSLSGTSGVNNIIVANANSVLRPNNIVVTMA